MTAHSAPISAEHESGHEHAHEEFGFLKKYIFSTDHKIIGIEFLFLGLTFFIVGGLLAMLVRWQLAYPAKPIPWFGKYMGWPEGAMPTEYYNQAFTMHATLMIFFVIIPILVGAFGNYLIPLMIGARDMAFPFLNGMAFWAAVPAGAIMVAAFFFPGGPAAAGWTSYPPLSSTITIQYHGYDPYRGVFLLTQPPAWPQGSGREVRVRQFQVAMEKAAQPLRYYSQRIQFPQEPTVSGNLVQTPFIGNDDDVLEAGRTALLAHDFQLETAADEAANVVAGQTAAESGKAAGHAKITVANHVLTIVADGKASAILDTIRSELDWQSSWPAISVLMVTFSIFLSFVYICAYYVRVGF